ncbi:MAG: carboxypeptidase-like regulatory domain-containing protein [Desulfococcaceae bacterium]
MMRKHIFSQILVFILFSFLFSSTALAHKVTVFAWVEGNTVYGEGKFSGGRKAQGAEVIVSDTEGNRLLSTKTDDNGDFSFPIPKKTGLRIELIAGMGHKGEWMIPVEEVAAVAATAGSDTENADGKIDEQPDSQSAEIAEKTTVPATLSEIPQTETAKTDITDKAELRKMIETSIEKSLDEKLKPLIRMLADSQQKGPGISEIAGGIGYIFGLMGLVLYFKSRKKKD